MSQPNKTRVSANLRSDSHQRALLASTLLKVDLIDFLSDAADKSAAPVLKKHGVKLPVESKSLSQAA